MGAFVLNDAFVRLAGNSLPLAQILFIRGLITTVVLLFFAIYGGVFSLRIAKKDKWRVFFRSVAEALTAYFFLTAVMKMPFANVTAISQILPVTVTLAAAFVFKEKNLWVHGEWFDFKDNDQIVNLAQTMLTVGVNCTTLFN